MAERMRVTSLMTPKHNAATERQQCGSQRRPWSVQDGNTLDMAIPAGVASPDVFRRRKRCALRWDRPEGASRTAQRASGRHAEGNPALGLTCVGFLDRSSEPSGWDGMETGAPSPYRRG